MQIEDQVEELLVDWVQARDGGHEMSAEELCRDCPELVPELQRQIDDLKAQYSAVVNRIPQMKTESEEIAARKEKRSILPRGWARISAWSRKSPATRQLSTG